jgi:hypothetical protein
MEEPRIAMVVNEHEARQAYEDALRAYGISYEVAQSFRELLRMTIDGAYNGLLIDLLTLIRSSKEEKTIAYDCINFYPTLRLKWVEVHLFQPAGARGRPRYRGGLGVLHGEALQIVQRQVAAPFQQERQLPEPGPLRRKRSCRRP